jgi:putative oxidoreductase
MSDYVYALGRAAVAVIFIVFGVIQFSNIAPYISNAAVAQFSTLTNGTLSPTVIAYAVATIDLVGGIMVLIGYKTRWAALVLFVFTGLTIYFVHHFWDMSGAARSANQAHAYKNLAIMGALLMLAAMGPGRISVDGRAKPAWN